MHASTLAMVGADWDVRFGKRKLKINPKWSNLRRDVGLGTTEPICAPILIPGLHSGLVVCEISEGEKCFEVKALFGDVSVDHLEIGENGVVGSLELKRGKKKSFCL